MKVFKGISFKIFLLLILVFVFMIRYLVRQDVIDVVSKKIYEKTGKDIYIELIQDMAAKNDIGYIEDENFKQLYDSINLTEGYVGILDENMHICQFKGYDTIDSKIHNQIVKEVVENKFEGIEILQYDLLGYDIEIEKIIQAGIKDLSLIRGIYFDEEGNACVISFTYLNTIQSYYLVEFYPLEGYKDSLMDFIVYDFINNYLIVSIFLIVISLFISFIIPRRIKKMTKITQKIAEHHTHIKLDENGNDELSILSKSINTMSLHLEKTKEELKRELEHVKKLENLRKEFIANFTHEIKTPIAVINGNLELLMETDDENKREHYAEIINHSIEKVNSLVLQMLDLSKLEANAIVLNKEDFLLEDLIMDMIDDNENLLLNKKLRIDLRAEDNIVVNGDKNRLGMVIYNFLSNAIKHSDYESTVVITINEHEFSIFNYGKCIDEEIIDNIWFSFVSTDMNGTGLGLAISKSILELHQFDYGVRNKENGVEFYFKY